MKDARKVAYEKAHNEEYRARKDKLRWLANNLSADEYWREMRKLDYVRKQTPRKKPPHIPSQQVGCG